MLMYSIEMLPKPGQSEVVGGLAIEAREALAEATGQPWSAWVSLAGSPYGTHSLTTRVEGTGQWIESQIKATTSSAFQKVSAQIAPLVEPSAEPMVVEIVSTTGEPVSGQSVVVASTVALHGGGFAASMDWGQRLAEKASEATGSGTMLVTTNAGPLFTLGWISAFADGAAVDAWSAALAADPGYVELLDEAVSFVVPASTKRTMTLRLP